MVSSFFIWDNLKRNKTHSTVSFLLTLTKKVISEALQFLHQIKINKFPAGKPNIVCTHILSILLGWTSFWNIIQTLKIMSSTLSLTLARYISICNDKGLGEPMESMLLTGAGTQEGGNKRRIERGILCISSLLYHLKYFIVLCATLFRKVFKRI